jgi:hypothetical protein
MKKALKVSLITIATLLITLILGISIVLWFVFTPDKLTPIVRKQASKYLTCQSEIGEVELTFFSTFPSFGLKVNRFMLINPMSGAPSDTLINADEFIGIVDVSSWWRDNELVLSTLKINQGTINAFIDSVGNTNFNILLSDSVEITEAEDEMAFRMIDIKKMQISNTNVTYTDQELKLITSIKNLHAEIIGSVLTDSITGNIILSKALISLNYDGEQYLNDAHAQLNLPVEIIPSRQFVRLHKTMAIVNDLKLQVQGTLEMTPTSDIHTHLTYQLKDWPLKTILSQVPQSFQSYLTDITQIDGLLTSDGSINGIYNDSVMPMLNLNLHLKNGSLKHNAFALPLTEMDGDVVFISDLNTDSLSLVRINHFSAKTPKSAFKTSGLINRLYSDIHCNLTTDADVFLSEFNSMLPPNLKMNLQGKVAGKVNSNFTLTQLEKMQLEKMKFSGNVMLAQFGLSYDSLTLKTDRSKVEFALPNPQSTSKKTRFAAFKIDANNLELSKLQSYSSTLENALLTLETSDVRDTTKIPHLAGTYKIGILKASMDTLSLFMNHPTGKFSLEPNGNKPTQPLMDLAYSSDIIKSTMGENTVVINKLDFETNVVYDHTQKDIFRQWLAKGFIDMDHGLITLTSLTHPIEIPSIKMNFDPENITIRESQLYIDNSDFQLNGNLHNLLSYFRGDSILRGTFNFNSHTTDVIQLMGLTSGIGYEEQTTPEPVNTNSPYMVPKGMDILLHANINQATFGTDSAKNIKGDIRVKDGILLLDEVTLLTDAAKIQLTAMYRTPRKNHLFLGLDYHMMDVEISELQEMIPDIDSIMPMLRSFKGKGEFHIAIETYLDSLYNIKKSTLRGASSVKGQNLVLLDSETFGEIAKTLQFNRKTENRVDSLSAEFTIFKEEIDIYPFLIVMDKYKAIISGRHNMDLSFGYHISVVDCPVPIKLGIDVKGTMEALDYKLARCKYGELYRPSARREVENKQMELRKMIRDALMQKVIK